KPYRRPSFGAFRNLPEALPKASFRRLRRSPCRTVLRRSPPVPETIFPKAPSDTPSNQTLRSFLRNAPRVPKVEPKDSFENDLCPRSPAANPSGSLLRNALGTRHVFPNAKPNTSPPGFFPSCHVSPNTPHREDLPRMSPEF